jgi:hypothetical protein
VIAVAVDLHDQPPIAPEEVDQDALDQHVRLGPGDAVLVAQVQEAFLEFAAGRGGTVVP